MLFVFYTTCSGRKFARASAVKLSTQSFVRNLCDSALISFLIQSSSSFWARARYSESVFISNSSNLFTSQNLVKKLLYSSNLRNFAYWKMKNPKMIGSLCSICALASSTSYNELFTWSSFLNSLLLMAACVLSPHVLRYSVSASVHNLIAVRAVS